MDGNQTYCSDHFTMYINIKPLFCAPEINIMLYVSFASVKKKKKLRKEILSHATAWMNLKNVMLCEISESHKRQMLYDSTCMRNLECKIHRDRK